jgi:D-arabinose 1-dehydrogenase-like Zn-dependent alcohol dehydrogenase
MTPGEFKLDLVSRLGADNVVRVDRQDLSIHRRNLQPRGVDIIVDVTVNPEVVRNVSIAQREAAKL